MRVKAGNEISEYCSSDKHELYCVLPVAVIKPWPQSTLQRKGAHLGSQERETEATEELCSLAYSQT